MQKKSQKKATMKRGFVLKGKMNIRPSKLSLGISQSVNKENVRMDSESIIKQQFQSTIKNFLPSMTSKPKKLAGRSRLSLQFRRNFQPNASISKPSLQDITPAKPAHSLQKKKTSELATTLYLRQMYRNKILQIKKKPNEFNYYITDVKRQIQNALLGSDQPNIILSHFLQSIATGHIFNKVRIPKEPSQQVYFPPQCLTKKDRPTLIFDMDETLLHCSECDQYEAKAVPLEVEALQVRVYFKCEIRPYAKEVLTRLAQKYEIGIFTAGREPYATRMLKVLDPEDKLFSFKLFRQHCHQYYHSQETDIVNVKDLRIINNRDIRKVILIDNSAHTYLFQPENAIPIFSYYDDQQDTQLLKLEKYLQKFFDHHYGDVRPILKDYFKIEDYKKYRSARQICNKLY